MNKTTCFLVAFLACQAAPFLPAQEPSARPEAPAAKPDVQEPKGKAPPAPDKEAVSPGRGPREDGARGRRSRASRNTGKRSPALLDRFADVVAPAAQCTVRVLVDGSAAALGTIVSTQGHVFTKASETDGGKKLTCRLPDGSVHPAELVATNASFDVALLRIKTEGLGVPAWKNAAGLSAGTMAAAPGPEDRIMAFGVLSLPLRDFSETDRGYLGIRAGDADGGALIESVEAGTAASKSGLQAKDIIQSVDETKIANSNALIRFLRNCKPQQRVHLGLIRDGETSTREVVLGSYARFAGRTPRLSRNDRLGGPLSEDGWGYPTALQHDLVLAPDQCGGPLVTLDGKAIGINIARSSRIRTFAIPTEAVMALMTELGVPSPSESAAVLEARKTLEARKKQLEAAESAARKAREAYQNAEAQLQKLEGN
jgi:serine protease Do